MNKFTIDNYSYLLKFQAYRQFNKNNIISSFKHIRNYALAQYLTSRIYSDDEIDSLILNISRNLFKLHSINKIKGRVVFWDSFSLDNRGLTQQYLRALISKKYKILYITENEKINQSKEIRSEILAYDNVEIYHATSLGANFERMRRVREKIIDFRPEFAMLHLSPWACEALTIFDSFSSVDKFLINLTDHSFWLGSSKIDYVFEFRPYGMRISREKRKIPAHKLLHNPFFPIIGGKELGLLPVLNPGTVVALSGGAYYKICGKKGLFFDICKNLLNNNLNLVILFAGSGYRTPLEEFIKKNKFEKRFILIGDRSDISSVMKACDFYIGTYPFGGGLMAQIAAFHGKAILSYTSEDLPLNILDDILAPFENLHVTHTRLNEFYKESDKIIGCKDYRMKQGQAVRNHLISENSFIESTEKFLIDRHNRIPSIRSNNIAINTDAFYELSLEVENSFQASLKILILRTILLLPMRHITLGVWIAALSGIYPAIKIIFYKIKIKINTFIKI